MKSTKQNKHRPHWYKITTTECPVCGRGEAYRERQYTPKPSNFAQRYQYVDAYDWCDAL